MGWKDVAKFGSGRGEWGKNPDIKLLSFSFQPHLT
jgi:hypothetical protein